MKRAIFLCIVFAFISCTEPLELTTIHPFEKLYSIDFTDFANKGFLITPEKYSGQYLSIGLINYEAYPGAKYKPIGKTVEYYEGQKSSVVYDWVSDTLSIQKLLPKVYEVCINMGADALVNFDYEKISTPIKFISNPLTIYGYRVTGFAIKRLDK